MLPFRKIFLGLFPLALVALIAGLILSRPELWQPAAVLAAVSLAIGLGAVPVLAGYQFTAWIIATVTAGLVYGPRVLVWGPLDLRNKWISLVAIQTVMFGMGTQMGLRDFAGVLRSPWGVFVAVFSQFTIMPLVGWGLTKMFDLPVEIAAGVILIGACSSGLASNVMCYIAKSNLALSITATACTTMLAPIMTPTWMKLLAGELVEVDFLKMMAEIVKIVLVPIGAGLLHDYLKHATRQGSRYVHAAAVLSAILVGVILVQWSSWTAGWTPNEKLALELGAFVLGAITFGVAYHRLTKFVPKLDSWMPVASMAGILYFTTMSTAVGRDNLLQVGGILFVVAALHNALGYVLGYWFGRAGGLDKNSCRTVAIEVGLQNGGMALGVATSLGKLATMGLAATVFSAWMNISGSLLANYWKRKPVDDATTRPGTAPSADGTRSPP